MRYLLRVHVVREKTNSRHSAVDTVERGDDSLTIDVSATAAGITLF